MENNQDYLALLKVNQTRDEFNEKVLRDNRQGNKSVTFTEKRLLQYLDNAMEAMVSHLLRKNTDSITHIMNAVLKNGIETEMIFDYKVDGVIKDPVKGKYLGYCHVMFTDTVGYSSLVFSFGI